MRDNLPQLILEFVVGKWNRDLPAFLFLSQSWLLARHQAPTDTLKTAAAAA
jgi:hypothetical protein